MSQESQEPWTPPYKKLLIDQRGVDQAGKTQKNKTPFSSSVKPSLDGM